jgi:acetyltransferase
MARLIEIARSRGLARMSGDILAANHPMLALVVSLGFAVEDFPGESGVRRVTLALG